MKEERDLTKVLVQLAVEEPGENWINETYAVVPGERAIPGWELPSSWAQDDQSSTSGTGGPRRHGALTLTYYSGRDRGCHPQWSVRQELQRSFLCGTRLYL